MTASLNRSAIIVGMTIILLVSICGGAGIWSIASMTAALDRQGTAADLQRNHQTADMMHDAIRADVLSSLNAATGSAGAVSPIRSQLREHVATLEKMVRLNSSFSDTPTVVEALRSVEAPLAAYARSADRIIDLAGRDPAAARRAFPGFMQAFSALEKEMGTVTDAISKHIDDVDAQAEADARLCWIVMLSALIGSVSAATGAVLAVRGRLVKPLLDLADTMRRLAGGDLDVSIPAAERADELGDMGKAVLEFQRAAVERLRLEEELNGEARKAQQRMIEDLGGALEALAQGDLSRELQRPFPEEYEALRHNFNHARNGLTDVMRQILAGTESMKTGCAEISVASDDLARRTEQNAASLEETAAAMDQITGTVRDAAHNTEIAERAVADANHTAREGGNVVRNAVEAMSGIERSSREIADIVNLIDGIAFQTNLLALNAGVEAARAGDAGKGFAVVASEVRALAQRSADAANHIKELIHESSRQVQLGVQLVGQSGSVLDHIVTSVDEITGLISRIAESASRQSEGLSQVNIAVSEMDKTTQQNAAMVEQSTAAAHSLAHEADEFVNLVSRFKLGGENVAAARQPRSAVRPPAARKPAPVSLGNLALAPSDEDDWTDF